MSYVGTSPVITAITPGTNLLTVDFTQSDLGDPTPTYYYSLDGSTLLGTGVSSSPLVISDISAVTTFQIAASNSAGNAFSDASSGTPNVVGSNPVITTITPVTNQLTVNFTQTDLGIPAATYYYSLDGSTLLGSGVSSSPLVISDISAVTTFQVVASNSAGNAFSDASSGIPNYSGSTPVINTVTPGTNQLTVGFSQSDTGSPAPIYYYSFDGTTLLGTGVSSSPLVISDISSTTSFYVIASNIVGDVTSDASSGTPNVVGSNPVITTITPGTNQLTVDFTQSDVGVPAGIYYYSLDGSGLLGTGVSSSPLVISDISAVTTFQIVASNSAGNAFSDASSGTPNVVGSNPVITTITPGTNQLTVDFTQSDVGVPVPTYYYSLDGSGLLGTGVSSSPLVISDISATTTFQIAASNSAGNAFSDASSGTPDYLGSIPVILMVTNGENQLTVDFSQTNTGSPVPTYYYSLDGTTLLGTGVSSSPLVITDISDTTPFYIIASNPLGDIPSSVSSGVQTFLGSVPVITTITPGTNQITIDFTQTRLGKPDPTYYYSFDGTTLLGTGVSSSPLVITDISAVTTFYVIASNTEGNVPSDPSFGTPNYSGSAPVINTVTPGTNQLTVGFSQSDTGSPAPTYYYSLDGSTLLGTGVATSPLVISDISATTTFYVVASNIVGDVPSDASSGIPNVVGSNPVITTITPGTNQLTVNFTQTDLGIPAATYYYSLDGSTLLGTGVATSPLVISDISAITTFQVVASNSAGNAFSDASSGIPNFLGTTPVINTVIPGTNQLTVNFTQSDTGSPTPTYYYSLDGSTLLGTGVATSPLVISDISATTTFYVIASNIMGDVPSDASSGTPNVVGSNPVITTITPGTNQLTVDFTQSDVGVPAGIYYYSLDGSGLLGTGVSSSPLVISDISAITTFQIVASNSAGNAFSDASSGTPNVVGSNPVITTITPGTNQLTVDFTQSDVGVPVPTYYYSLDGSGLLGTGVATSPLVISDISAITTFQVVASNSAGNALSDASSGTPDYLGSIPVILMVTNGENQLTVDFIQTNTGSPAPTYYYSLDGTSLLGTGVSSSPLVITDISDTTPFYIIASNPLGDIPSSVSSGVQTFLGSVPVITTITPGTNQLTIDFTQTRLGKPDPMYYYSLDGTTLLGTGVSSSPLVISDISATTTFYVIASNTEGNVSSDASSGTPNYSGSVPVINTVTPGTNQLTINFTQSDTGSPAPTYYYSLDGSTLLGSGVSSSPLVISDISATTTFYVVASNIVGDVPSIGSFGTPNYLGSAPVINTVTPGTNQLTVDFSQNNVGSPAPIYYYSFDGTTLLGSGVSSSPLIISDISATTTFYVVASNATGNIPSDASSGTPNYSGSTPVINTVIPGTNQLTVNFTQSNTGSPTPTYYYSFDGSAVLGTGVSSSPLVISDISATTTFYVIASNIVGDVLSDASSGTPYFLGTAPVINTITPGTNQLTIGFSQSATGSPAPTYYYSFDGSAVLGTGVSSSPLVITDISSVQTVQIVASNAAGNVFSDASSAIPEYIGSAPTITNVVSGYNQLTVSFTQSNVSNPPPTYYYSLNGISLVGSGVSSSPLVIPTINVPTQFYVVASNTIGNVFSSQTSGAPLLVRLNEITSSSLNVAFQIRDFSSSWLNQHSYNCSQIMYLQGPSNSSSPTGYEYVTAYVNYAGTLVIESYTNDVSGSGFKSFEVSFEDRTNTRFPTNTLYICNANINENGTISVGFYYYLVSAGLWTFAGSLITDAISTSYMDWSVVEIGRGRTAISSGNRMYSQLSINNVELFPIVGPWLAFYKSYVLTTSTVGTGSLSSPYYTFNYAADSGNLPLRVYMNGNLTSGISTLSDSRSILLNPGDNYTNSYAFNYLTLVEYFISAPNNNPPKIPCFGENARILCFNKDLFEEEYVSIKNIRRGMLVKTLKHGYVAVEMIGKTVMRNNYAAGERHKNRLYKCTKRNYPEMTNEDLILTGCHSILVEQFKNEDERRRTVEVNRKIYITDDKYRLPACVDERAEIYDKSGTFTIYHLALQNDDYYMNYGIYANGLLVETSSRRYMRELSNMELL